MSEGTCPNRAYAASVFGACDDGSLHPDDADWNLCEIPLAELVPLMPGGADGWRQWLCDEIDGWEVDFGHPSHWRGFLEAPDFADHIADRCDGPCVVSRDGGGRFQIWDGWHRIACAIVRGYPRLQVMLGTEKPGFHLKP